MRQFGKRPNSIDFALIEVAGAPPICCKLIERSVRMLRLEVEGASGLPAKFVVIANGGKDKLFCQAISVSENYIIARFFDNDSSKVDLRPMGISASFGESQRWLADRTGRHHARGKGTV
jgi:hypothetical protein